VYLSGLKRESFYLICLNLIEIMNIKFDLLNMKTPYDYPCIKSLSLLIIAVKLVFGLYESSGNSVNLASFGLSLEDWIFEKHEVSGFDDFVPFYAKTLEYWFQFDIPNYLKYYENNISRKVHCKSFLIL
jgi:hypothetical protein